MGFSPISFFAPVGPLSVKLSIILLRKTQSMAFTGVATGALTYSFIKTLEQEPELTYGRLLIAMRERVRKAPEQVGLKGSHESQEPQLSTSQMFDIHSKPFTI
ncbi:unnamed protein product [Fraxinus pennsylvanica]|uniref:Uncharacterized protein n=1 Tax=Fraxinus pennsylvanica TaxID=56036 RepID=A0AAD2DT88_9LAMI|nr:unnamed protein product [Fraxinus pennsylvanica]